MVCRYKGGRYYAEKTSKRRGKYPKTKGRTMGRTLHSRSRSGNRKGHHQERSWKDTSGSKRKAEESHRGKCGNRLRTGQDLHGGELAGGVDGELRKNQATPIDLQNLARLSEKPHQAADRQHPTGRPHFSGLTTVLQAPAGWRAGRPHRGQEKAERFGTENRARSVWRTTLPSSRSW